MEKANKEWDFAANYFGFSGVLLLLSALFTGDITTSMPIFGVFIAGGISMIASMICKVVAGSILPYG